MKKENSAKSKMKTGGRLLTVFSLIVFLTVPFIFAGCNQPDDVGARLYSGTETPNLSFGKMGDFYIDEDDNLIYKFGSNGWYVIGNMQGEKGDQGEQGIQGEQGEKGDQGEPGVAGANGISFLSGQGTPSSSLGSVDDLYLNTLTYDLYKKDEDRILEEVMNDFDCKEINPNFVPTYPNVGYILNDLCDGRLQKARYYDDGIEELYDSLNKLIKGRDLVNELLLSIVETNRSFEDNYDENEAHIMKLLKKYQQVRNRR